MKFESISEDNLPKIKKALKEYIFWGGLPEIAFLPENKKIDTLQGYFNLNLFKASVETGLNKPNAPLKTFYKRVNELTGQPLSINKIYHEIKSKGYKVSKDYLYEYQEMGEAIFLLLTCYKFDPSVIKRTYSEKKAYAVDNGFLNALTFKFSGDYSTLLKNLVYIELSRRGEMPYFYKDRHECDFVTFQKDTVTGLYQVAYDLSEPDTLKREKKGLVEACKALGKKAGTIISYTDDAQEWEEDGIEVTIKPALHFFLNQ